MNCKYESLKKHFSFELSDEIEPPTFWMEFWDLILNCCCNRPNVREIASSANELSMVAECSIEFYSKISVNDLPGDLKYIKNSSLKTKQTINALTEVLWTIWDTHLLYYDKICSREDKLFFYLTSIQNSDYLFLIDSGSKDSFNRKSDVVWGWEISHIIAYEENINFDTFSRNFRQIHFAQRYDPLSLTDWWNMRTDPWISVTIPSEPFFVLDFLAYDRSGVRISNPFGCRSDGPYTISKVVEAIETYKNNTVGNYPRTSQHLVSYDHTWDDLFKECKDRKIRFKPSITNNSYYLSIEEIRSNPAVLDYTDGETSLTQLSSKPKILGKPLLRRL